MGKRADVDTSAELWRLAASHRDLCALGERFVRGEISFFPGWNAPDLDAESDEIVAFLALACRAGFLPCASQPATSDQRAFVAGFADESAALALRGMARDLDVRVFGRDHGDVSSAEPVSRANGRFHAFAGHDARTEELACFEGVIGPLAFAELQRAAYVSAFDPQWGRRDRLWSEFARVLQTDGEDGVVPRFVVLGASNVTRGFDALVARVRGAHRGPVEILAAHGCGRSFGLESRFLWVRELVSIDACGLWSALAERSTPTHALVCDIGNDLAYGVPPATVAGWVERAVDRLLEAGARVVVAGLPLSSLDRLGPVRFEVTRALFFPGRSIELKAMVEAAHDLNERLSISMRSRTVQFVAPKPQWFGLDPVHVRPSAVGEAWSTYLEALGLTRNPRHPALGERLRSLRRRPAIRHFAGFEQRRAQPCLRFDDGTSVSEY